MPKGARKLAKGALPHKLAVLAEEVSGCRACKRLTAWREEVAEVKRAAYREEEYWGRPVSGFGDPEAKVLVLGLAPGAHGANRTGRVFTGDESGKWLYRALWRAKLASKAVSVGPGDGLELRGAWVSVAVRCAPPGNKPTPVERDACAGFLRRELAALAKVTTILALGGFAWEAALRVTETPRPWAKFGHGAETRAGRYRLLGCYHVSQQNTFTGRLSEAMLDEMMARAKAGG